MIENFFLLVNQISLMNFLKSEDSLSKEDCRYYAVSIPIWVGIEDQVNCSGKSNGVK